MGGGNYPSGYNPGQEELVEIIRRSRNKLLRIFDGIQDPIYIIDRDYNLVSVNRVQASRYGASPSELVGKTCYRVFYNRDEPCSSCPLPSLVSSGEPTYNEVNLRKLDGKEALFEIYGYPISDDSGYIDQAIIYLRDVTERRRLERLAAIGEASAAVVHEIKSPLTVIQMGIQLLSKRELDPERKKVLHETMLAVDRMRGVVQEILDFARGEGSYELVCQPLLPVLQQIVDAVRPAFQAKSLSVKLGQVEELSAKIDKDKFFRAGLNLAVNALEALPGGGELVISLDREGNSCCVKFEDNGPGIPEEIMNSLFDPFVTSGKQRGTGLGLAISYRIVSAHGGKLVGENKPGNGASFRIYLPCCR